MEIYVDDEAKLTLHGLVQVCLVNIVFPSLVDILFFFKNDSIY